MKVTPTRVLSAWLIKRSSDQCQCFRIGPDKRPRRPPLHVRPCDTWRGSSITASHCHMFGGRMMSSKAVWLSYELSASVLQLFFFFLSQGPSKLIGPQQNNKALKSGPIHCVHLSYQIYASSCFNWFSQYSFICLFALLARGLLPNGFFVLFCCLLFDATANELCRLILSPLLRMSDKSVFIFHVFW